MSKALIIIVILGLILVSYIFLISPIIGDQEKKIMVEEEIKDHQEKAIQLQRKLLGRETLEDKQEKAIQLQRKLLGRNIDG